MNTIKITESTVDFFDGWDEWDSEPDTDEREAEMSYWLDAYRDALVSAVSRAYPEHRVTVGWTHDHLSQRAVDTDDNDLDHMDLVDGVHDAAELAYSSIL